MKDNEYPVQMVVPDDIIRMAARDTCTELGRMSRVALTIACVALVVSIAGFVLTVVACA